MKKSFGVKAFVLGSVLVAVSALGYLIVTQTAEKEVAVETKQSATSAQATFPDAPAVQQSLESTVTSDQSTVAPSTTTQRLSQDTKPSATTKPVDTDVQAQRPTQTTSKKTTSAQATGVPSTQTSQLAGPQISSSGVGPIEAEIFRLTNAYRANPTGPLARPKPLPQCGPSNNRKQVTIAQIQALQPLILDVDVSLAMSRVWSKEMSVTSNASQSLKANLRHSDNDWRVAIYKNLGILGPETRSYSHGENILVFSNYRSSVNSTNELAKKMFEGWRDSDGHFCNIINDSFTHLGVGHYYDAAGEFDWATQNFHFAK